MMKTVCTPAGCQNIEMTADEEAAFISDQTAARNAAEAAALKSRAQQLLDASDMTAIRCLKAGVAFPIEWRTYVTSLRATIDTGVGLPNQPAYPEGT